MARLPTTGESIPTAGIVRCVARVSWMPGRPPGVGFGVLAGAGVGLAVTRGVGLAAGGAVAEAVGTAVTAARGDGLAVTVLVGRAVAVAVAVGAALRVPRTAPGAGDAAVSPLDPVQATASIKASRIAAHRAGSM